jgi:2-polyprenyl-3-methyl-5-hydroxy-6-metoxy-1,4-benzoquinol methylase
MPLDFEKLEDYKKTLTVREMDLLELYVNESIFFYSVIQAQIGGLPKAIYEIGSGIGLLARMTAENGHKVVATDPGGHGFNAMSKLHAIISDCFQSDEESPKFYNYTSQEINEILKDEKHSFDFIFAANVIEHVSDLEGFFDSVLNLMNEATGTCRFICPNYAIPYEPHFGFFTLFSKRLTYILQKNKIMHSSIAYPKNFYEDLTFPTVFKVKRALRNKGVEVHFSRNASNAYLDRVFSDNYFMLRKKKLANIVKIMQYTTKNITQWIPIFFLPIIDVSIAKRKVNQNYSKKFKS